MTCKTCEDCLHENVCASKGNYDYVLDVSGYCTDFKNKADFVEVVTCRDCKYHKWLQDPSHGKVVNYCDRTFAKFDVDKTDFCSYGERRDT